MPGDELTLAIGGQVFAGWTDIEVATGIDAVASSFELGVTERWAGHPERWAIPAGTAAVVAIGGEPVVTGYVDRLESDLSDGTHGITASGRSRSADLVDCSAVVSPGSWSGQSLETIASALAAPFGVTVTAEASTAPVFAKFALQPDETPWDAIGRMLKQRGLIGITGPDGNIRIVSPKPGPAAVTIRQGEQPISIRGSHDVSERFSSYILKGQASGSDQANGASVSSPKATASDPGVARYRPLIIVAEDQATPASLAARAQWEASVRAAKAQHVTIELPGWRDPAGALWQPMRLVQLTAPAAWIDDALMVVSVTLRAGRAGRLTELTLGRPEAYTQMPLPEDAQSSSILRQRATAKVHRVHGRRP